MTISRREFCPLLLGALCLPRARAASTSLRNTTYRVDAVVSMLGVPLFTCAGVGSAFLALDERCDGGRKTVSLHFAGGSNPEKAHGIVYAGSLEESIVEQDSAAVEASYFGFITASQDETLEQARRKVSSSHGRPQFVAVEGLHRPGRVRNRRALVVPEESWRSWAQLIRQVRTWFYAAEAATREIDVTGITASDTFLYAVRRAARATADRWEGEYVHNARSYRLECEKLADHRTGVALAAKNLTACPERVIRLTGKIRETGADRITEFRCWMEEGNEFPLRIDFQPRTYLRLRLDKES